MGTAQFVALLVFVSSGTVLGARTIKIKLLNGKSGLPKVNTCVNAWVGASRKGALAIPTEKDGAARIQLTDKDAELKTQNPSKRCGDFGVVDPVAKYADSMRVVTGYVVCQPHAEYYSWLATMEISTKQVIRQGIVTANTCGKSTASPTPGELVIFVRPLTWWEKLKQ